MGGGKKKQSLSQMTKERKTREPKGKEKQDSQSATKKNLGLTVPDIDNKKVLSQLKGLKVLTPSVVAERLNIRLSLAKSFLREMERRKMAEYVSGGKNLKIYKLLA
jgi:small subunit ribosomal protein S25e